MADLYPSEPELISLRDDPRMRAFLHQRGLPVDASRAASRSDRALRKVRPKPPLAKSRAAAIGDAVSYFRWGP